MVTETTTAMPTWRSFTLIVTTRRTAHRTNDNGPRTEEPDEAKVSRPILERRRGGRPPRRP
jgi:hypothetical protein